jgi:YidC/Oxa1 family membrane protein insertase
VSNPDFEYMEQMGETLSLFRSDVLVSDWSAMALEYSLGLEKPVLFIDVPRRIRNPDWQELDIEPMESAIRNKVGEIVAPTALSVVPEKIRGLLSRQAEFTGQMRELRNQMVYRLGHSVPDGAAELLRIADELAGAGEARVVKND